MAWTSDDAAPDTSRGQHIECIGNWDGMGFGCHGSANMKYNQHLAKWRLLGSVVSRCTVEEQWSKDFYLTLFYLPETVPLLISPIFQVKMAYWALASEVDGIWEKIIFIYSFLLRFLLFICTSILGILLHWPTCPSASFLCYSIKLRTPNSKITRNVLQKAKYIFPRVLSSMQS